MTVELIKEIEKYNFTNVLKKYPEAIQVKSAQKKKVNDQRELLKYDKWIQDELYSIVQERKELHINKEELIKIMKWKLLRGKWRPRLVQLVESNPPESVVQVTTKAIELSQKKTIQKALQKLCELKGVGPATASAILSSCVPQKCAFFADEVATVFLKRKLNYSLQEFLIINDNLRTLAEQLNKKEKETEWNPHKVELAIWTYVILKTFNPHEWESGPIPDETVGAPPPKRRRGVLK